MHVLDVAQQLSVFSPEYFFVTDGGGGSAQDFTVRVIAALQNNHYQVAPHLSCIGASKKSIRELLHYYQAQGVKRIVALRGDLPSGLSSASLDFQYARDLVQFIRAETGDAFHISVAAYPESHPQAQDMIQDLLHFKAKVDAGANSVITQYFYHPDAYVQLLADCQDLGVQIPIIPGIMPIYHFDQLCRFSERCGVEIPRYVRKRIESYGDDVESVQAFGVEVVSRLCQDLLKAGAPSLHFYSLNQHQWVTQILKNLA